jgi:hypothetical protein
MLRGTLMGISAKAFAIWLLAAALVASVTLAPFAQALAVLTGTAAYGDWRSDAPGMRRKITPADLPPPYATASASNGPTIAERPFCLAESAAKICRRSPGHWS